MQLRNTMNMNTCAPGNTHHQYHQEYISNESVQLLQAVFLHIDIMNTSINATSDIVV